MQHRLKNFVLMSNIVMDLNVISTSIRTTDLTTGKHLFETFIAHLSPPQLHVINKYEKRLQFILEIQRYLAGRGSSRRVSSKGFMQDSFSTLIKWKSFNTV